MVTVFIHSVRVSLMSHHRVVLLKDADAERYLPIWIGPYEADAIVMALQGLEAPRPLTHDLLKNAISALGGTVSHILVAELSDNTYYGRIVMDADGRHMELDARPSDAMALAVRCGVPIYVADRVMAQAGIAVSPELEPVSPEEAERLSAFRDFVNTLDLDEQEDD
ncbi:MAG TPA: bifunctional nuclease family protein [Anaerolineae bacterium]|nr:bifunctional nuclease family protein [Anaerolineae bacterium]